MVVQLEDMATLELPGIESPKRGRGRPSTGKARSSAERMRDLRARQRTAIWGASDEAKDVPVVMTGLIEELRRAVVAGYDDVARNLSDRLVQMAKDNKRNNDNRTEEMKMIRVIHLQRGMNSDGSWFVIATRDDTSRFYCGSNRQTERGSKRMLSVRAKQFNLRVSGNEAASLNVCA